MYAKVLFASLLPLFTAALPLVDRADNSTSTAATIAVSNATIDANFVRPAQFSRIAYCSNQAVESWNCGPPCLAIQMDGVVPLVVGGDGGQLPRFFVAHDPRTESLVVAHQGTDVSNPLSVINDVKFVLKPLNSTLFPQAGADVLVHDGFAEAQGRSADIIMSTVQAGLAQTGVNQVFVTGHSLGAAIAAMDALMLRHNLPASVRVSTTVFGLPRGGNPAYADLIDSELGSDFTFVTHRNDPVPVVPPRFLGYQHSAGEVHIVATNDATGEAITTVACPGQENQNCSDGNSLLATKVFDHIGPYFANVSMSGSNCPL
ncbi:alpha/beta-hydrolase [Artomyces pyxidatus]|uniref:Alpha/beta-hydrolase n=1 Tax=Artomyces pyxidatus TaxID=48021 RepID=A0ACB8SLI3_9AGAM|nr:alpha/beta-hydrolase [Artomyces pyxidatus]